MANGEYPLGATWVPTDPSQPAVYIEGVGGTNEIRPCKYRVTNSFTWNPAGFTAAECDGAVTIAVGDRLFNQYHGVAAEGIYIATSPTAASLSTTDVLTAGKTIYCTHSAIGGPFRVTA